jgi:CheY-like chemotaxis protein
MSDILVVEDDARLRAEISGALRSLGHRVDAASGGHEALDRLREKRYDLLHTDLMMEEGTGFEVLEWVRENAPGLPVLVCSSYAKPENLKTFLTTQFYRIVRKPCSVEDLLKHAAELLAGRRSGPGVSRLPRRRRTCSAGRPTSWNGPRVSGAGFARFPSARDRSRACKEGRPLPLRCLCGGAIRWGSPSK